MRLTSLLFLILLLNLHTHGQSDYADEIRRWDSSRVRALKDVNGWLNLAGLFWLKEGVNRFGTDSANDVVFPKGSVVPMAGNFILEKGKVTLLQADAGTILINNRLQKERVLFHPDSAYAPVCASNSFRWTIIRREDKYAIRLRDLNSPVIKNFKGINRYPADSSWRVEAMLEKGSGWVTITNVLGQTIQQESPGRLVFTLQGKTFKLDALKEGNELFIIIGDETSALTTYGAGRYIYAKWPDNNGKTILDFNKAFNPPCAFTDFATCPLPPKQNILPIAITAGEKDPHAEH
jgi:uncharacterized protein (DUF1684 family)